MRRDLVIPQELSGPQTPHAALKETWLNLELDPGQECFRGRATQASVGERPSPLDELPNDPLWGGPNRSVISGKAFCISYLLCKKIIPKLKSLDNNTSYFNLPESRI